MTFSRFSTAWLVAAVLALAALPAHAARDRVQFFSNIDVPVGSNIHDAVCFFCSVDAKGPIDHDVVVFFGDVHIGSQSNHDVVSFFGDVIVDDNASISHDVVHFFGTVRLGQNATIGNDLVVMMGDLKASPSASIGGNQVIQPAWLALIPLLLFCGFIYLIVSVIRSWRERQMYYAYPPQPPPPPMPPAPPQA